MNGTRVVGTRRPFKKYNRINRMKEAVMKRSYTSNLTRQTLHRPGRGMILLAVLAFTCVSASARDDGHSERYRQMNLVSDLAGVAVVQDTNLVNAWGISFSATSPFWVSANGTGKALLYSVTNGVVSKVGLEVSIPGEGNPTGQVFNNAGGLNGDIFIFASEDGTISGWRPALGTAAEVLTNRPAAIYKGLALVTNGPAPMLLAANFGERVLDAFDLNANLIAQFSDSHAPSDYAPFNVQSLEGHVFVTFAKTSGGTDDVPGPGHGLIDIFNPATGRFHRLATGSDAGGHLREINSPWGVAIAPRGFGRHRDSLLVGNFGSGTIMSFEADGDFRGLLKGENHHSIVIEGLWGLTFGNGGRGGVPGTLYFSAGPGGEGHGLFGSLDPVRRHDHD
jgi:uncharacterized protein (TIGR03118 family)